MNREQKERDIFIIPHNFIEKGKISGGSIRLRNAFEAVILVGLSGRIIFSLLYTFFIRIIILCCISLPLVIFAVIGIDGSSLSSFFMRFLRFFFRRHVLTEDEENAYRKKWWTKKGIYYAFKRFVAKIPRKKVKSEATDFEIVYYDSEDDLPQDAKTWNYSESSSSKKEKSKIKKK